MKTARDKHVVVSADFAGFPLKEVVKKHLAERGWMVDDHPGPRGDTDVPTGGLHARRQDRGG